MHGRGIGVCELMECCTGVDLNNVDHCFHVDLNDWIFFLFFFGGGGDKCVCMVV